MNYYVDRVEEQTAFLQSESGEQMQTDISQLPAGVKEGSVLEESEGTFSLNKETEEKRKRKLYALMKQLLSRVQ